jgi:hypothetical protein
MNRHRAIFLRHHVSLLFLWRARRPRQRRPPASRTPTAPTAAHPPARALVRHRAVSGARPPADPRSFRAARACPWHSAGGAACATPRQARAAGVLGQRAGGSAPVQPGAGDGGFRLRQPGARARGRGRAGGAQLLLSRQRLRAGLLRSADRRWRLGRVAGRLSAAELTAYCPKTAHRASRRGAQQRDAPMLHGRAHGPRKRFCRSAQEPCIGSGGARQQQTPPARWGQMRRPRRDASGGLAQKLLPSMRKGRRFLRPHSISQHGTVLYEHYWPQPYVQQHVCRRTPILWAKRWLLLHAPRSRVQCQKRPNTWVKET